MLPYQVPINAVSGPPIATSPTDDVDEMHARYMQAVKDLFEKYKAQYTTPDAVLEIY